MSDDATGGHAPGRDFGDRIQTLEETTFVGRAALADWLGATIAEADVDPRVIAVVGPGGIGKTSLVRHVRRKLGPRRVVWLAGDSLGADAAAFSAAIARLVPGGLAALGRGARADVLVLDGFDALAAIEGWFFDEALPKAGPRLCVVLTTRSRFLRRARLAPGLRALTREVLVPPLAPDEARAYLGRRNVPPPEHGPILAHAAGHPRALGLLADRFSVVVDRASSEDGFALTATLAADFLADAPSALHETALHALALPRALDESILERVLGVDAARTREILRWLGEKTFVDHGPDGLVAQSPARRVLHDHFAAMDRARHLALAARATEAVFRRAALEQSSAGADALMHAFYIHRHDAGLAERAWLDGEGKLRCRAATPNDVETFAELLARSEGEAARARFHAAFAHDPAGFRTLIDEREVRVAVVGVVFMRALPDAIWRDDPLLEAARRIWSTLEPDRQWDLAFGRWLVPRVNGRTPEGEALVAATALAAAERIPIARHALSPVVPGARAAIARALDLRTIEWHDARRRPLLFGVTDLHALLGGTTPSRRSSSLVDVPARPSEPAPLATLDGGFVGALREALPLLVRPRELDRHPRVKVHFAGGSAAIRRCVEDACAHLQETHRDESARVIRATYLAAPQKQRAIAADLNLPFGTFRHRLRRAIDELAHAILVLRESEAAPDSSSDAAE